ncbi:hypothetical protein SteCoe_1553 [Stentor coeruleus]|uniref:PIPK domain-containing protein n=1 Tax=Stentor coeruleus TaxID=5963 RepID=A0A1R2D1T9_9CILI|nr:hypothetical protein SteCoe_1553 [Stentor coeruleus]
MLETIDICYSILAPISAICGLFQVYGFYKLKLVNNHPEILVFWQCVSQLILDIHWFTGISYIHKNIGETCCLLLGDFFVYFYYLSWNYTVFLSVEILIKMTNPCVTDYKKRTRWYHLISHALSICIFFVVAINYKHNNGKSIIKTCFVQKGSFLELIVIAPVFIHFPIATGLNGYTIYKFYRAKEIIDYLRYIIFVVIAFSIAWVPVAIVHGIQFDAFNIKTNDTFLNIAAYLGALSGTLIFTARMMEKNLLKRMLEKIFCRETNKKIPTEEFETRELKVTHADFFTKVTAEAIMLGIAEVLMKSELSSCYGKTHKDLTCTITVAGQVVDFNVTQFNINEYAQIIKSFNLNYQEISQYFIFSSLRHPGNFSDIKNLHKKNSDENETFSYYTSDKKYILKTIKESDMRVLKMMAQKYMERVTSSKSYLLRIFGAFEINSGNSNFYVILIENFNSNLENAISFQLNGRKLEEESIRMESLDLALISQKSIYNDDEFFKTIDRLNISKTQMNLILKAIEKDTNLLRISFLMEYKLCILLQALASDHEIIAVDESRFFKSDKYLVCIGIDFINKNQTKKNHKKSGSRISISGISPEAYRKRFIKLIKRVFKDNN